MATRGRLVFDGDNLYTEKEARIYKLKNGVESAIDSIPGVVDSLDSTSTTDALSANMGKELQDQINTMSGAGKFLSTWDSTTGLPNTNPQEDPYTYRAGDYYIVSNVGATNYKPHGGTYTQGVPSTAVETDNVGINDKYYYDGATWTRIADTSAQITIDTALSTSSTNAVENRVIATAINTKQNTISDLTTIRSGASAGATAIQPNDNISQLTNNIGYQTAGDVASAISTAIQQLPTVNDGTLTIQKNGTSAGTFSANQSGNSTVNITVPTTVAELSDANDYATKTYADNVAEGKIHSGATAPSNPTEGQLWYDTTNDVLKVYDGTNWNNVDTNTTYSAGTNIQINGTTISATDTTYTASSFDIKDLTDSTGLRSTWSGKQDVLTAGSNISISGTTISATDTTYTAGNGISIINGADYSAMRGPAPMGFHIPTDTEWTNLITAANSLGVSTATDFSTYFKLPLAGWRNSSSSSKNGAGTQGYYWTSRRKYMFSVNALSVSEAMGTEYGYSLRAFKDVPVDPDGSWITLVPGPFDSGIFYSAALGLISVALNGTAIITIANKNIGATSVWNYGDTETEVNSGYMFQWGNNYGFPFDGSVTHASQGTTDTTGYGPGNYYSSDTFYYNVNSTTDWSNPSNPNLWGYETGVITINNAITSIVVSDEAYAQTWDGDTTHSPSKNAVYDVIGNINTLLANI